MIFESVNSLRQFLSKNKNECPIYMTSGGFDPLHIGHVRCILDTALLACSPKTHPGMLPGITVVIVNADSFLIRKKGYVFMPLRERLEIINAIKGVDFVAPWETNNDQTVIGAITQLRPRFFSKGGDRFDASTIPEWDICQKIGCEIITGIGAGGKVQSSSDLVERFHEFTKK